MKNTNIFYRILKIGMIVADVFIACVLTALCVLTFISQEEFSIALMLSLAFVFGFSNNRNFLAKVLSKYCYIYRFYRGLCCCLYK